MTIECPNRELMEDLDGYVFALEEEAEYWKKKYWTLDEKMEKLWWKTMEIQKPSNPEWAWRKEIQTEQLEKAMGRKEEEVGVGSRQKWARTGSRQETSYCACENCWLLDMRMMHDLVTQKEATKMQEPRGTKGSGNTRAITPVNLNEDERGNDTPYLLSRMPRGCNIYLITNPPTGTRSSPGSPASRLSNHAHGLSDPQATTPPQASAGTDQVVRAKRVYVHHNHAQRRLLDCLIKHGCINTDPGTWEDVKTVWMLVPVKNGGGLGVGLRIEEVMHYVEKNARKHWQKGKETREIARQTWAQWIESHRKKIKDRPVVNNAGQHIRLGEEIVGETVANRAVSPHGSAVIEPAPEALPLAAPLTKEHVLKFREINSRDIDPTLVDVLYEDGGRIIHPLSWRKGFGIYGPDDPLPCHNTPHSYPMRAMPTDRYTMSTISAVEPQSEPPLYPLTEGIVTIQATVARGYENPIRYHMLECARAWGFGINLTVSYPFSDQGEVTIVARAAAPWERNILSGMETMGGLLTVKIQWA
ncbi:hypothetical protein EV426DRAFT_710882 [Tirmania nivea]|nr:hypothetical protein EV426DRAFT_710882 [Tirmania nivea]